MYGKLYLYYLTTNDSGLYQCELEDGRKDTIQLIVGDATTSQPPAQTTQPNQEECNFVLIN